MSRTSQSAHGTTVRAKSGCPCRACDAARTTLYMTVARGGTRPKEYRVGDDVVVLCDPRSLTGVIHGVDLAQLGPTEALATSSEKLGPGARVRVVVVVYMLESTYRATLKSDSMLTAFQTLVSDVETAVPHAIKRDLSPSQQTKHRRVVPGKNPRVTPLDLTTLQGQLINLVTSLASDAIEVPVAMKQYGVLRDQVAARRLQFSEVEGIFEVVQQMIVAKVDQ